MQRLRCPGGHPTSATTYSKLMPDIRDCRIASRLQDLNQITVAPRKWKKLGLVVARQSRYTFNFICGVQLPHFGQLLFGQGRTTDYVCSRSTGEVAIRGGQQDRDSCKQSSILRNSSRSAGSHYTTYHARSGGRQQLIAYSLPKHRTLMKLRLS